MISSQVAVGSTPSTSYGSGSWSSIGSTTVSYSRSSSLVGVNPKVVRQSSPK